MGWENYKHSNGIIAATAIKEELREYIIIKVYIYIYKRSLWTTLYRLYFKKNFIGLLLMTLRECALS